MSDAPNSRRPSVALVAYKVTDLAFPPANVIRLASQRIDFTLVSSKVADELKPLVRWRRAPAPRSWNRLTWALFSLAAWIRVRGIRADLVHTAGPAPIVVGPVDLASVIFCHSQYHEVLASRPGRGLPGLWRLARRFTVGLERACYRPGRVRMLIAECASGKQTFERHFPGVDVAVVPTPIDTTRFRPDEAAREELRLTEDVGLDGMVALFVGRDWEVKGLDFAIRGLAEAARLGHGDLRLWVLGTGNLRKYEALAEQAGIGDRVRFFGYRRDVERFYQAADVFLLPTVWETFCRAAYEAAACGLPLVATRVDGISELIGDSESGLFVERDTGSIGSALARLAGDPELRSRLGREGRRRSQEFTVERAAEALVDTYQGLLGESVGPRNPIAVADHLPER